VGPTGLSDGLEREGWDQGLAENDRNKIPSSVYPFVSLSSLITQFNKAVVNK
jgi:hypothetical protein